MDYWKIGSVLSSGTRTFALAIPCSVAAFIGQQILNPRVEVMAAETTQDPNLSVSWVVEKIEVTAISDNSKKDEIYLMVSNSEKGVVRQNQYPGGKTGYNSGSYHSTSKHSKTPAWMVYNGSLTPGETSLLAISVFDNDQAGKTQAALNNAGDAALKSKDPYIAASGTLLKGLATIMGTSKDDLMGHLAVTFKNEGGKLLSCVKGTGHEGATWSATKIVTEGKHKGALQGAFYRKGGRSGWGYTVTLSPKVKGVAQPYAMLPGCTI